MKKLRKQALSLLLCACLTAGISIPVRAEEGNPSAADTYTAAIAVSRTNSAPVRVGQTLKVDVGSSADFSAAEITVTYDPALVSFDAAASAATLGSAAVADDGSGTLKLADYGESKDASDANYTLAFQAIAVGSAVFELTEAAFGTGTSAVDKDLAAADISAGSIAIAIAVRQATVKFLDDSFYAPQTAVSLGSDFVFYPEQETGSYYVYELPKATYADGSAATVTATDDGGWKIANISGDVTVAAAVRTPKNFGAVTYTGSGAGDVTNKTENAVYLSDIRFSIPEDKAAGTAVDGYTFSVSAAIGGTSYTFGDPAVADGLRTYTIPGAKVTGAVTITVIKTIHEADKVIVSIGGNAAGDGKLNNDDGDSGAHVQVDKNGNATLTVDTTTGLNKGYIYEVKNGDEILTLNEKGEATITNITESTTITINRTLNVTGVTNMAQITNSQGELESKNYVTLNGTNMWLIQLPNHVENTTTAVYKYKGEKMYWSADHKNYVLAVISDTAPVITADQFTLEEITATPTVASNNWDVNKTGVLDVNDAQLIWNMYSNEYQGFSDEVTVEKFLLADANHDGVLDLEDAAVIIERLFA